MNVDNELDGTGPEEESLVESLNRNDLVSGGRALGMISGAAVFLMAIYFVATISPPAPHVGHAGIVEAEEPHSYDPRLNWIPMIVGSALAVCGGYLARSLLLVLGFLVGFFWNFLGLYALLVPLGSLSVVGWGHIGYLLGAALLWRGRSG